MKNFTNTDVLENEIHNVRRIISRYFFVALLQTAMSIKNLCTILFHIVFVAKLIKNHVALGGSDERRSYYYTYTFVDFCILFSFTSDVGIVRLSLSLCSSVCADHCVRRVSAGGVYTGVILILVITCDYGAAKLVFYCD